MGKESLLPPYVISSDVQGLLESWTPTRNLTLPQNGVLESLRDELRTTIQGYFEGEVQVIDESFMRSGLSELIAENDTEVISLDRAYISPQTPNIIGFLDLTRGVNEHFQGIGVVPRPNARSEEEQLDRYKTDEVKPITLVDDVLFEGESVSYIKDKLAKRNRPITKVIAGISVSHGRKVLNDLGIEVISLLEYDEVKDEVCERDFRAGVPMSGRTVFHSDGSVYSAPYFEPFGNTEKWASIPKEHSSDFASMCLEQTITLWEAIEKASDRRIPTVEIPRQLRTNDGMRVHHDTSITDALKLLR